MEWIDIPGGEVHFVITGTVERGPHEGESYRVEKDFIVEPFRISKYAVSNAEYQAFVDDPNGYANTGWWRYSLEALERRLREPLPSGDHDPRTHVSWFDALAFCRWLNHTTGIDVTLPTEAQWLRAYEAQCGVEFADVWEWCWPEPRNETSFPTRSAKGRAERAGVTTMRKNDGFRLVNAPLIVHLPNVDEILAKLQHEPDHHERCVLLDALGVAGDPRVVDLLIGVLFEPGVKLGTGTDGSAWPGLLREAAARALGHIGDARAVEALIRFLGNENNRVRYAAGDALVRIGAPAFDPLVAALSQPQVSWEIVAALGRLGDPRAIEPLLALIQAKDNIVARTAQNNLKALIPEGMNHPDAGVRAAASRAAKALET